MGSRWKTTFGEPALDACSKMLHASTSTSAVSEAVTFDWSVVRPQLRFIAGKHCEAKRHWLTQRLSRLALLDPVNGDAPPAMKQHYRRQPGTAYCNDERLSPAEVGRIVARSHCRLAFSSLEGFCRASSEYLLSGVPVVSTASSGGRDVWYDAYNSIIVEPDIDAVYEAVQRLVRERRDPARIRASYLARAQMFQARFARDILQPILRRFEVDLDPFELMRTLPFRWWQ